RVTVDVERLASAWLREQDDLTELARVVTVIPKTPTFPLVRLTLIDERQVYQPRHLTTTSLQIDCYGGPKALARLIADTVCDLLADEFPGAHPAGVITSVTCSMRYLPDATYKRAKPRYIVSAEIYSHP